MMEGILLFIMVLVIDAGAQQQRRLRVKTIENITAEVTTVKPATARESAIRTEHQSNIITTTVSPRTRLRRPTTRKQQSIKIEEEKLETVPSKENGSQQEKVNGFLKETVRHQEQVPEHIEFPNSTQLLVPNKDTKEQRNITKKSGADRKQQLVQQKPESTVISTSNQLIVSSSSRESNVSPSAANRTDHNIQQRRKKLRPTKGRGDNHIHVESNYTVTSRPTGNSSDHSSWKTSRIKENVRRKNILSRTSADPVGVGSESRIQVHSPRSRQGIKNLQQTAGSATGGNTTQTRSSRPLVKLPRNRSTVYNFETGKLQHKKSEDQSPSTSNEVPNEEVIADDYYKYKNQNQDTTTAQPQKRYSSRYRGKKQYGRGNHVETSTVGAEEVSTSVPSLIHKTQHKHIDYEEPLVRGEGHSGTLNADEDEDEGQEESTSQIVEEESVADKKEEPSEDTRQKGEDVKEQSKEDVKHSEGSGGEHHSDFHATKGEKHKKGYKGGHDYDKGSKGFHDSERHSGEYRDEKGSKKAHKEGGGHFEAGEHEEKGQKSADHAEKEQYKKGHSTRGGHTVHKLDEYEKKLEFFDESHESGDGEKFGSHFESYGGKKGGHKKGGQKHSKSSGHHKAKKGKYAKGKHNHEDKGHDKKSGKGGHFAHAEKYGKEGGKKNAHKYHFSIDKLQGGSEKGGEKNGYLAGRNQKLKDDHSELSERADTEESEDAEVEKNLENRSKLTEIKGVVANDNIEKGQDEAETLEEESGLEEESAEDVDKESQLIKNVPNNARFMNEDGPTSYFTKRAREKTAQVEREAEEDQLENDELIDVTQDDQSSISHLPEDIPRGKGYFMSEDDAIRDKEEENALEVFNHLHDEDDHRQQRSYKVNEEDDHVNDESRTRSHRIQFLKSAPVVKIVTKSILPPL